MALVELKSSISYYLSLYAIASRSSPRAKFAGVFTLLSLGRLQLLWDAIRTPNRGRFRTMSCGGSPKPGATPARVLAKNAMGFKVPCAVKTLPLIISRLPGFWAGRNHPS